MYASWVGRATGVKASSTASRVRYQHNLPPSLAKRSWVNFTSFGESSVGGGITVVTVPHLGVELGDQLPFMGKSLNQKCVKFIIKIIIPLCMFAIFRGVLVAFLCAGCRLP